MDGEEAIYYLEYLRHDVHAKSLYDVALVKAIDALKQGSEPVKHGQWLHNDMILNRQKCSECGFYSDDLQADNYCPNCGARMDGES